MKALMIVDMLNDFVKKNGALPVAGAHELVENIKKLSDAAHIAGIPVIYVNDSHDEDDIEFKYWPKHSIAGTDGAKVIAELTPAKDDIVLEKKDLLMFTNKEADSALKKRGIKSLYIVGVATEYCVKGVCIDNKDKTGKDIKSALSRGFGVNLVVDAISGVDLKKGDQFKALIEMGNAGVRPVYAEDVLKEF